MAIPKHLQEKWNEAAKTGKIIDIGVTVVCDVCDKDYTNRADIGGFIFGSNAYCPKCANERISDIRSYGEEHYIKATCGPEQSFADFVREYRGGNNTIQIQTLELK